MNLIAYIILALLLLLLIDCWRTEKLLPLFGSLMLARVVWSLSFLLANPVLILLYLAGARFRWWKPKSERVRDYALVIAVALFGWLQLVPASPNRGSVDFKQHPTARGWSMNVGATSVTSFANFRTTTRSAGAPIAVGNIRITTSTDDLSWTIGQGVARLFSEQAWTQRVELMYRGQPDSVDVRRAPDIYVDIDAGAVDHFALPIHHTFRGPVQITMTSTPHRSDSYFAGRDSLELGTVEVTAELKLDVKRVGMALGSAAYGGPADAAARWFDGNAMGALREKILESGIAMDVPASEDFRPVEAGLNLGRDLLKGKPGNVRTELSWAPFVHSRICYQFQDSRPADVVLGELQEQLLAAGWSELRLEERRSERSRLHAQLGDTQLMASRWPMPLWRAEPFVVDSMLAEDELPALARQDPEPTGTAGALFGITIETPFSPDELVGLGSSLVPASGSALSPADLEGLLVLRRSLDDQGRNALRTGLREHPQPRISRWLLLAKLDMEAGDSGAATSAIRTARALDQLDSGVDERKAIKRFCVEHGLDLDSPQEQDGQDSQPSPYELLKSSGLHRLDGDFESAAVLLAPGEEARFLVADSDGDATMWILSVASIEPELRLFSRISTENSSSFMQVITGDTWLAGHTFEIGSKVIEGRVELRITRAD